MARYFPSTTLAKVSSWLLRSQWEGDAKGNGCAQHSDLPVPPYEWTACDPAVFTREHKYFSQKVWFVLRNISVSPEGIYQHSPDYSVSNGSANFIQLGSSQRRTAVPIQSP